MSLGLKRLITDIICDADDRKSLRQPERTYVIEASLQARLLSFYLSSQLSYSLACKDTGYDSGLYPRMLSAAYSGKSCLVIRASNCGPSLSECSGFVINEWT